MGVYIWSRLPSAYQEVEYIQSSGTQYINTDFVFSTNTEVTLDIQYTSTTAQQRLVGTYLNSSPVMWEQYINGSTQWARSIDNNSSGGYWQSTNISADTNRHTFVSNNSRYIIYTNGTQVYNGANTRSFTAINDAKLTLLAGTNGTSITNFSRAKLYGCKITDNGTLVRDFIPCYRKSDSVIGLYDLVNNQFYTNSGSGTFSKGSDVDTYRESLLKNAYIGEVWTLEDSFSGTSLDTSKWNIVKIANIGTVTVNNSLQLSTSGAGGGNAGGPIVETIKKIDGTEKKIIVEATTTATNGGYVSIGGYTFNWVSESSYYKCNGNLPICLTTNGNVLITKSSTSFSGSNNAATTVNFGTTQSLPCTLRTELDITNKTVKVYNGANLLANGTIPSNVNLSDWIGQPIATMNAVGWNSRSLTISNIDITVE